MAEEADLENMLLEAAGRGTAGRNRRSIPPKRRREGSYSDSGDDASDGDRGYSGRKPSRSQVPLKKRLDADRDDEHGIQGEGDYEDDGSDREGDSSGESVVGEDLYKDEADKEELSHLTELEREMILSERADKKGDKKLAEKFRSKRENERTTRSRKETPPLPSSRGVRSSARSADRSAAKDDALNELRAKRLKQQDPEAHRKLRDASRARTGGQGFSPIKRKTTISAALSSSSQSDSENGSHSDDETSTGDGGMADSDDDRGMLGSDGPTFEDIKGITIRRTKLAKWFMEPWFEEVIVGCFVRVGIGRSRNGPVYRLCMVRNVDATEPDKAYKLESKTTHKYLNCIWGSENSAARWQMAMVSDSAPNEEEFRQWVREVERTSGRLPSKQDLDDKKDALKKINSFVYSPETVKQMLQEKKSASSRPLNVAAEKERLRRELEIAESKHDEAEAGRIKSRLQELEAARQAPEKDSKALKLAEMNRKNRVENFRNASGLKPVNTGLKAGEAGYDPFSRRWTKSRNYYLSKPNGGDAAVAPSDVVNGTVAAAVTNGSGGVISEALAATTAALEAAAGAGKLVDTGAPVDQGTESNVLHNFEIPLSLVALQKLGGPQGSQPGFMARKQSIEAIVGYLVPENDGRRHALTLTVGDYKRRRGLL
ncbi:PAF1 complex component isoform 1 [Tripterygium wilfordii]|uniref:PAF1 complex component isoform 1 n=1 Tax=Tripterygium wilfordii TaxID=458696 RepID=A0A7J7DDJ6_TRIWF|nr:protein RTF1 homolog [Tripterygium wilfordii]XP_038709178.1 protein RTF1 homolog [Tripterygium wilfordii]KAF5744349.1 PAF1 complex component isoform 1 [Tripterygium wilfordii]